MFRFRTTCLLFFAKNVKVMPQCQSFRLLQMQPFSRVLLAERTPAMQFCTRVSQAAFRSRLSSFPGFTTNCIQTLARQGHFRQFRHHACQNSSRRECRLLQFSRRSSNEAFDPGRVPRRKKLMTLTYISLLIGSCLLGAIFIRHYGRFKRRALGIEEIKLREYLHGRRPHLFKYRGYVLPAFVINEVRNIHTFDIREDDVWIVTFPKSGTTWIQEIVYLVLNDADFEKASEKNLDERSPYFEFPFPGMKSLKEMQSPRILKTHLPLSLLPNQVSQQKPKIIYTMRNPKDTLVSYYFFTKSFASSVFNGTFDDYCRLFLEDTVSYGPWWKHVAEAWQRKDQDNILVLQYEDLQKDLESGVRQIADFLNKPLSNSQVEAIAKHCSFDEMRKNNRTNYKWFNDNVMWKEDTEFMRKGKIGDWKNHLSKEVAAKLDEVVAFRLARLDLVVTDTPDTVTEDDRGRDANFP